MYNKYFL